MEDVIKKWLFDPTVGKLIVAAIGLLIVFVVVRSLQRGIGHYIQDTDTRYRARKFVTILGYVVGILVVTLVYSKRLAGFTVAFGVAGAGIAFALQEVIASLAGWVALSFGNFYHPGDRVQLGGIKGDVIDIGILRTTLGNGLMEICITGGSCASPIAMYSRSLCSTILPTIRSCGTKSPCRCDMAQIGSTPGPCSREL